MHTKGQRRAPPRPCIVPTGFEVEPAAPGKAEGSGGTGGPRRGAFPVRLLRRERLIRRPRGPSHGAGRMHCPRPPPPTRPGPPIPSPDGCPLAAQPHAHSDGGGGAAASAGADRAPFGSGCGVSGEAGRRGIGGGGLHLSRGKHVDTEGLAAVSGQLRSLAQRPLELIKDPGATGVGAAPRRRQEPVDGIRLRGAGPGARRSSN